MKRKLLYHFASDAAGGHFRTLFRVGGRCRNVLHVRRDFKRRSSMPTSSKSTRWQLHTAAV